MKSTCCTIAVSLVCLMAVSGCTVIRVSQDYKKNVMFSEMKTYGWKDEKQKNTGDIRIDNPFNDQRIREAVDKAMIGKGYGRTSGRPDVFMAYSFSLHQKISGSSNGPVIGFGYGTGGRGSVIGLGLGTGYDVTEYDEGYLVIDISDGASGELLWRGTSIARIDTQASPEKKTALFNHMVEKNMSQFPPDQTGKK